jgi:glycosyltransferase involved in cell wall biosynthesis
MKILLVQDYLRSGGTERHACLLANAFAAAGHATTLLTFRPRGALADTLSGKVTRLTLQRHDLGLDWFAPGLSRTARAVAPDVVVCLGRMANSYAARLARRLPDARVIATLRTGKPLPWFYRRSLRRVAHVVANSDASRATAIERHGVPPERISVIHNPLVFPPTIVEPDPTLTLPRPGEALRAVHGAGPRTLVLVCVGMFRPEKNQIDLIRAVAGLPRDPPWQLWLAGDGTEQEACALESARLGLQDRVRFLGMVSDPRPVYEAADLAVLTSRRESLSNFLIEAHAHGVPSVAYAANGVVECGGHVVPVGDLAGFRTALAGFVTDPARRLAESRRVRAVAENLFSPARQLAAYYELFRRLRAVPPP